MKTLKLIAGTLLLAGLFFSTSCQKNDDQVDENEKIALEDAATDDMMTVVDEQIEVYSGGDVEVEGAGSLELKSASEAFYPIVSVTFPNATRWPVVITIDYGPTNFVVRRGVSENAPEVKLRGKIIITKTGPHYTAQTSRTITFQDFYINDYKVEGSQIFTTNGLNDAGNYEFTWSVDLQLTSPSGVIITREVEKVREMVKGSSTPRYIWDDEFEITGWATGSSSRGWAYTHTITKPVVQSRLCRFPLSGTIFVENLNVEFSLDYGTGECDNIATITDADGNVKQIVLGRK
jgi:hypothetical protein